VPSGPTASHLNGDAAVSQARRDEHQVAIDERWPPLTRRERGPTGEQRELRKGSWDKLIGCRRRGVRRARRPTPRGAAGPGRHGDAVVAGPGADLGGGRFGPHGAWSRSPSTGPMRAAAAGSVLAQVWAAARYW
jgi:hypothetical protein